MGLASKVKNIRTNAEYTTSTVPRTDNIGSLEVGDVISESAIYDGYPSPLVISKGKRPFLIVLNMHTFDDNVSMDSFHALMVKMCTDEPFKSPLDFRNILLDNNIEANLVRKRQAPYGVRKVDILFV